MFAGTALKRAYIDVMMRIVGRGLAIASRIDAETGREVARLPMGTIVAMRVNPHGPGCFLQRSDKGLSYLDHHFSRSADVEIIFKHLQHAWLLFTFQENTPTAFSRNRIVLQGEVAHATTFNRCLDRLLTLILPRWIAQRAMKRYPSISLWDRLSGATAIYLRLPLEKPRAAA